MELFQVEHALEWMANTNEKIQDNKEYLTMLDQAIGDGDHGINMARGFGEVMKKLNGVAYQSVADVMKDVAMTLMTKVGGAAGPLYGTAFLKLSMTFKGANVDYDTFSKGFEDALNGVKQRGKANIGEKTLVDVWSAIANALSENEGFHSGVILQTAKSAMEGTKDIKATKGRAAYIRDRSVGHLDPGSVSSYFIFESLAEVINEDV